MKALNITVKFEQTFCYEFEDGTEFTDDLIDNTIDGLIENLSDRTNNYWKDADIHVDWDDDVSS